MRVAATTAWPSLGKQTTPNTIQIDPDEFPALARILYFGADIDGYLQNLGIDTTGLDNDLPIDVS